MPEFQISKQIQNLFRIFNHHLEGTIPHQKRRWSIIAILLFIFYCRIFIAKGYYVVAYALSIYLLNVFLMFLSPKIDPASLSVELENGPMDLWRQSSLGGGGGGGLEGGGGGETLNDIFSNSTNIVSNAPTLPSSSEFRPFIRRLPEFKAFTKSLFAIILCLFLTLFPLLDIPVYWPILVFYFISLTLLTLRKQVEHMVRYRYVPWDFGKKGEYK